MSLFRSVRGIRRVRLPWAGGAIEDTNMLRFISVRSLAFSLSAGLLLTLAAAPASQAAQHDMAHMPMSDVEMSKMAPSYELRGQVVKLEGGRVVLTHEAIAALQWPAMTMPFQLAKPELAEGLTPGLQIVAQFEKVENDAPRILSWHAAK